MSTAWAGGVLHNPAHAANEKQAVITNKHAPTFIIKNANDDPHDNTRKNAPTNAVPKPWVATYGSSTFLPL